MGGFWGGVNIQRESTAGVPAPDAAGTAVRRHDGALPGQDVSDESDHREE